MMDLNALSDCLPQKTLLGDNDSSEELEVYHNTHDNMNDLRAYIRCSESNYVPEDFTVHSEKSSDNQSLKFIELNDENFDELISVTDKELTGEFWLFEPPNIDRLEPLDLTFSALNTIVFIEKENNLLRTLRSILNLQQPFNPLAERSARSIAKVVPRRISNSVPQRVPIVDTVVLHPYGNANHGQSDPPEPSQSSPSEPSQSSPPADTICEIVAHRRTFSINPKRRLSMIQPGAVVRRTLPRPAAIHASTLQLSPNEPNHPQKLVRQPTSVLPQMTTRLVRPRVLPLPPRNAPTPPGRLPTPLISAAIPDRLPTPLTSVAPLMAPSLAPSKTAHSQNPLSRTFDKDDFQLLKSVTNTASSTSEDVVNNNGDRARPQDPKKTPLRPSSGLRPPSQPRARAVQL